MEKEISIVLDNEHEQLVVSSLQVAENFGKQHKDVIKGIEKHISDLELTGEKIRWFYETSYTDKKGEQRKQYLMNRDGFSLLVMSFSNTRDVLDWKIKYINAFNEMEKKIKEQSKLPTNPKDILKLIVQANEETDKKVEELRNDVEDKFKEMPLFNSECEELEKTVRKVGTKVLGGYHSPAYNNTSIRQKVYSDIHRQVKHEFGVSTYKSIKREYHDDAMKIINEYRVPMVLRDEINRINNQQSMDLGEEK